MIIKQANKQIPSKKGLQESWKPTEHPCPRYYTKHRINTDTGDCHDPQILPEHLRN